MVVNRRIPGLKKLSGPGTSYRDSASFRRLLVEAGKAMREVRTGVGDSQQEYFVKTGSSELSKQENGKSPGITLWSLWRLADTYGYEVKITFEKRRKHTKKASPRDARSNPEQGDGGTVVPGRFDGGARRQHR